MAFFDFFKGAARKLNRAIWEYSIFRGSANIMPDNPDSYITEGYSGNTSVYSIIDRIDKMRKQAPLKLYRRMKNGDVEEVTEHELLKFRTKVNADVYTDDYITAHLVYLLTVGEFFTYKPAMKTGMNKGKVNQFFEMPSNDVEIIEGSMFEPVGGYRVEDNQTFFTKDEVYHSKLFNPNYSSEKSLHGQSPLRAAAKTVSKLNEIETTELKQFENQGAPYVLFKKVANSGNAIDSNANRLTDEQRKNLIKEIKKSGNENTRGLPLVLKDEMGKLDLGNKLADLEIIESSEAGIIALCGVYGMPPELMGYGDKTYNNMSTARKAAWTDCIMPYLGKVSQTFNACTIADIDGYSDLYWDFDFSEVEELQEGMKEKVDWMVRANWSGNEIRVATGKAPSDNELMDEPQIGMGTSFLSDYGGDDLIDQDGKSFEDYEK